MKLFKCPTAPNEEQVASGEVDPILGCGHVFDAEPDEEGLVDCPYCGIWFRASEPGVVVEE